MIKLQRFKCNPILKPKTENRWKSDCVFNPGVVYSNGLFHMLYRGMGVDDISRISYAVSSNRFDFFCFDKPVFYPELLLEPKGCEDPRLVLLDNRFYMTYTAYSKSGTRIGIAYTHNFLNWERLETN